MLELMGLVGIVVFFAGLHQLWLAREEALFWLKRFADLFHWTLGKQEGRAEAGSETLPQRPPAFGTLHLVGGLGLVMLGSFLCLVSLALVVFVSRT